MMHAVALEGHADAEGEHRAEAERGGRRGVGAVAEERGAAGGVPPARRVVLEPVHRVVAGAVASGGPPARRGAPRGRRRAALWISRSASWAGTATDRSRMRRYEATVTDPRISRPARQSMRNDTTSTPDHEDGVAEELQHGDGGELDDGGDVAVDALDEQAGAVTAVPVEVQAEGVASEVEAQAVADPPGQPDRLLGDEHLEGVGAHGDHQEHGGEPHDLGGRVAGEGRVDRVPEQHGAGHRRQHGDEQHHAEDQQLGLLGPQVRGEQARI